MTLLRFLAVFFVGVFVAGCGDTQVEPEAKRTIVETSSIVKSSSSLNSDAMSLVKGARKRALDGFTAVNQDEGLRVSGLDLKGNYSSEMSGGVIFFTGEEWETAASGQTVLVSIRAKSTNEKTIPFKVKYLTREVGSSRWREFEAATNFKTFEFRYDVNEMKEGNDDNLIVFPRALIEGDGLIVEDINLEIVK